MSKITKEHPLILVCYISRYIVEESQVMAQIADNMNRVIAEREANAMVFFIPTDGPERMECINPVLTDDKQKEKINKLIDEISKSFDIGQVEDNDNDDYESSAVKPFKDES